MFKALLRGALRQTELFWFTKVRLLINTTWDFGITKNKTSFKRVFPLLCCFFVYCENVRVPVISKFSILVQKKPLNVITM